MKNLLFPALLSLATLAPAHAQSTQTRAVPAFHAIQVSTGIELDLAAGHSQRVAVSAATDAYRDRIETTVEDGVLKLRYKNPDDRFGRNDRTNKHLRVAVTADELTALGVSSGASVRTSGDFDAATFQLDVSSGASVRAGLDTNTLTVRQSSGSSADLRGRAASLDVQSSSGATFDAASLQTERRRAQASSGGSISYKGSPQLTKHTSSGGSVGRD